MHVLIDLWFVNIVNSQCLDFILHFFQNVCVFYLFSINLFLWLSIYCNLIGIVIRHIICSLSSKRYTSYITCLYICIYSFYPHGDILFSCVAKLAQASTQQPDFCRVSQCQVTGRLLWHWSDLAAFDSGGRMTGPQDGEIDTPKFAVWNLQDEETQICSNLVQ